MIPPDLQPTVTIIHKSGQGPPWQSGDEGSVLPLHGAHARSLVMEGGSHMLCSGSEKKKWPMIEKN